MAAHRYECEAPAPNEEAERIEAYVESARDATERAYLLLRHGEASAEELAAAVAHALDRFYQVGQGAQACRILDHLKGSLPQPDADDPDAFEKGLRAGFAAGCLVQWRVLEYLVGEEMPLWPVQRYSTERQVD